MTSQDKHVSLEMVKIKLKGGEIKQHNHAKLVSYKNSKIKCHAFYFPVPSQSPSFGFLVFTCNSPLKQQNNIVHWTMFNHFITPPIDLNIPPFSHITSSHIPQYLISHTVSYHILLFFLGTIRCGHLAICGWPHLDRLRSPSDTHIRTAP